MVEVTLNCLVVGEGNPFPVVIDAEKTVGILKDKIKEKKQDIITFDADKLDLYRVDGLTQNQQRQILFNGTPVDMSAKLLSDFDGSTTELAELSLISECFNAAEMNTRWKIHVLVVIPREMPPTGKRSIEELGEILDERLNKFFKDRDEKR
ncbi:hypothetical protein As57867_017280, partial [Aphanomyces stellatus]